ncbi:MAG: UTP--glucose-1-phosphate uridylyltransferase GalU [bacterium]|nr:UTP--glucose-1-phosphate uridylyltransferase GalU [bacterium]
MGKVTKAVIPAAGYGMRFLPVTKAIPKEMLPIVDTPTIEYIVRECVDAGITDILIIVSANKNSIINHFDRNFELEYKLKEKHKDKEFDEITELLKKVNIFFVRQKELIGLGHAVLCAKSFAGNDPFALLLGDDLWRCRKPAIKQLIEAYEKVDAPVLGVKVVDPKDVSSYGICKTADDEKLSLVLDLVEKPKVEEAPSRKAISGRYILTPDIFTYLETQGRGAGNEIQLTDAIKRLSVTKPVYSYELTGKRYDIGSVVGFVEATLDYCLSRNDIKEAVQDLINDKAKK